MPAPVEFDGDRKNEIFADDLYPVHITEIYLSLFTARNKSVLIEIEINGERSRALDHDL